MRYCPLNRVNRRLRLALATALVGCGAGESLSPAATGTLAITAEIQGNPPEVVDFKVSVDGGAEQSVSLTEPLLWENLEPGSHSVALLGVSAPCAVLGPNPATASVVPRLVTTTRFVISCTAPPPASLGLQVRTTTVGVDLDPDGYTVHLDPSRSEGMGVNDTVSLTGLEPGTHRVRLGGLAPNCFVDGENPTSVTLAAATETIALFHVACWPPLSGRIVFSRSFDDGFGSSGLEMISTGRITDEFIFSRPNFATLPAWSPDFSRIAYFGGDESFFSSTVWVKHVELFDDVELPGCGLSAPRPSWSPDGGRILCLSEDGVLTSVDVTDLSATRIAPSVAGIESASWSPTGVIAVRATSDQSGARQLIYTISGTELSILVDIESTEQGLSGAPEWSPDGSRLALVQTRPNPDVGGPSFREITIVAVASGEASTIWRGNETAEVPRWSPDGAYLLFTGDNDDGNLVVRRVRSDGTELRDLGVGTSPSWSPDGTRIVFSRSHTPDPGFSERVSSLYVMNADGTGVTRLTALDTYDVDPAWAP